MVTQELQELIEKAVAIASKNTADRIYAKIKRERELEMESIFDRRLYNTKLLMEHYRLFKEHAAYSVYDLSQIDEEAINAIEIMDSMLQTAVCKGEISVESIKNSVMRTKIVIDHIDDMLLLFEESCIRSQKPEFERKWDVISTIYIKPMPEGKTRMDLYEELAEKHFVSDRQIRRDIDDAIVRLTALLFGIDGVRNANILGCKKEHKSETQKSEESMKN